MQNGASDRRKTAIVLFNLGGPDGPEAIQPFLFNLFNDPAIIRLPGLLRWCLAWYISHRRAVVARNIYAEIGGASPLLAETEAQARALEQVLNDPDRHSGRDYRVFVCMRYWRPMSDQVAAEVVAWGAEQVILAPLYPQFSTTTTGSSVTDWRRAAGLADLTAPTSAIQWYAAEDDFVAAHADLIRPALAAVKGAKRVLFSAHGLPKKIIAAGDPYQGQIEQSAGAIAAALGLGDGEWVVCYQSKVGRLEWIGPTLDQALAETARDCRAAVIVPLSFVSEHSETLVELDIEYRKIAEDLGIAQYRRVATLSTEPAFIAVLARLVGQAQEKG
jgi:ferrochelatase